MPDLSCDHKKHAVLHDGVLEVKCNSRFCGAVPGVVILHQWDASTGEFLGTLEFLDPFRKKETQK